MERRGSGKAGGVGGLARKVTPDDDIIDTASIPYVSTRLGRGKAGGLLAPEANGLMKKSIDNLAAGFLGSVPTKSFFNNIKSSSSNYLPSSNSVQSNHDEVNGGSIEDISLVIPDVSAKLQLKRNSMFVFTRNRMNSLSVVPENGASSGLRKSINNLAANLSSLVSAKSAARSVQQLQQQQQQIQQQKSDIEMPAAPVGTMTSGGGGAGRASRLSRETSKSSVTSLGSALQISIQRRTSTLPGFRSINHPTGGGGPIGYDPRDVENLEFLKLERKRVLTEAANSVAVDSIYIEPLLIPLAEVHFQLGVFVREIFLHTFPPLYFLLIPFSSEAKNLLKNREFIPSPDRYSSTFFQWIIYLMVIYVNVYTLVKVPSGFQYSQLVLFNIVVILRTLVVATKFAYASPLENERMVHSVEPVIDSRNRQILSGWLRPSRDLRNVQLLFASVRQECDLTLATFELQSASETALFGSENELCKANRSNGSNNGQGNNYTEEASPLDESPNATGYHHQEHQSRHHQSSLPSGGFGSLNIDNSSIISKPSEVPRAVLEMKANLNETYGEYMGGMGSPTVTLSRPPRNNELQPLQVNSDGEFLPSDEPSSLPPLHQQQQKHESTGTTTPPSQNQGRMSTVHQFQLANKVEDRSMKRIPAWYAATEILDSACEQTSVASSGLLFGIVHAIIPYIANSIQRFVKGENNPVLLDDSLSTGIPLSIAVSLAGIFLMTTNFMFLMVGIQDFKRRLIAQQQRHAILRNGFLARPRELDAVIEKINIKENRSSKVMKKKKIQKKLEKFTFTTGGENQEEGGTAQEQESEEVDQDQQDNSQNNGINIDINDENNNENSGRDLDRIQQEAIDSVVNMQRQSTTRFYEKIRKGSTAATTTGNNNIIRSSVVVEEEASDENNNTNHHSKSHTVDFDKEAEVVEDGLGKNDNQKSNGFEPIIRIPMDRHQNILTWWYLRVVLQDYGLAYQKRIALFCGYFVLYMAALLVAIVIEVMLQTANIDLATVLYIGFHGLTISLLVITMVRYGSQYNHSRKEDVSILIRKQMDLEIQLAHIQQLKKRHPYIFRDPMSFRTNKTLLPTEAVKIEDPSIRIKQAIDALKTVQAAVIVDNGIHGIRILGFEAGHELVQTMVALLLTGLTLSLRSLFL